MPVVWGQDQDPQFAERELVTREWRNTVGQSGMTPTAFAFLIPVFVIVVFAPFLCIFCMRRRRQPVPVIARKQKKPALRRAEARERLDAVTQVSNVTAPPEQQPSSDATAEQNQQVAPSSTSFSERECAICLSALHAPSPPEPARLVATSIVDEAATRPPSINDTSPEVILKLNVCGHEFHAECLTSWVVLHKTSCPICRAVYITKEEMTQYDEEAALALATAETTPTPETVQPPPQVSNWRYFWRGENAFRRQPAVEASSTEMTAPGEVVPEQTSRRHRFWPQRSG